MALTRRAMLAVAVWSAAGLLVGACGGESHARPPEARTSEVAKTKALQAALLQPSDLPPGFVLDMAGHASLIPEAGRAYFVGRFHAIDCSKSSVDTYMAAPRLGVRVQYAKSAPSGQERVYEVVLEFGRPAAAHRYMEAERDAALRLATVPACQHPAEQEYDPGYGQVGDESVVVIQHPPGRPPFVIVEYRLGSRVALISTALDATDGGAPRGRVLVAHALERLRRS